ncbi:MAG: hypothetical protein F6K31_07090 [Symploca sp. SIO2G7]|nr:hypothetical protein [Symploca sp. SIO2G7]
MAEGNSQQSTVNSQQSTEKFLSFVGGGVPPVGGLSLKLKNTDNGLKTLI